MEPVLYDIKDAARYLGVAPSTLRYWEREGLVRAGRNRGNDYRQYALHDLIDASEIAFYRRLGVPVRELAGYRTLSARDLDDALDRTARDVEQRIAELEAMRARLARQRALNARAEELEAAGMRPGAPGIARLDAIDYADPALWPLLVDEPWRFAVLVDAADPGTVFEMVADTPTRAGAVWERDAPGAGEGRECLLLVVTRTTRTAATPPLCSPRRRGRASSRALRLAPTCSPPSRRARTRRAGTTTAPGCWADRRGARAAGCVGGRQGDGDNVTFPSD